MSAHVPTISLSKEGTSMKNIKVKNPVAIEGIELIDDSDSNSDANSVSSGSTIEPSRIENSSKSDKPPKISKKSHVDSHSRPLEKNTKFNPTEYQNFINNQKAKPDEEEDEDVSSDNYSQYSDNSEYSGSDYSNESQKEDKYSSTSKTEKKEILIKLAALEKRGVSLTKKFSMSSKLSELKIELELHKNTAAGEAAVKFQQKALMAAVTGLEFLNNKFDPVGAKLDGWSESVMDNLDDYDDVFMKLYEKYKGRGDLPPELQLFMTLAGSAFMFHLTKKMFSTDSDGESKSDIMNNIMKSMGENNNTTSVAANKPNSFSGPSINLASMMRESNINTNKTGSDTTVETSKEVTISSKGKRALNL